VQAENDEFLKKYWVLGAVSADLRHTAKLT
jgi:hypothetical protein